MVLHESANLEKNRYCASNFSHMYNDWNIEHWKLEYTYTHIWVVHRLFQCFDFAYCESVAFQAEMALAVVEVHLCLCVSSVTADSLLCHFGKQGNHSFDFHYSMPNVFILPPSPLYAQETQLRASSLLGLRHEVFWLGGAFHPLWRVKTLLWPF